ncbi:hypothetical protein EV646_101594 [Kribbella antiqua]|uniref:Uncharacterized protein n=1 Tax=Kribbella antiqua TaxID=2512217 RepID=A0A4R2J0B8_9ACTN|nr:hypothetical protein [Kribbella antiqua]TCO51603.1 hypothetical protein EV646_101594 [Kribbella antiqua]
MPDDAEVTASPAYAVGQLQRALERALAADDAGVRRRAVGRAEMWRAVLDGVATGRLTIGSRTPVANTPAWVTLEVAHGGFATGRFLAESALGDDELARLRAVPGDAPGTSERERLNLWYLGDEGLAELLDALRTGRYRIDVPEEGALLVVAWLLEHGRDAAALDLVAELRPLMHRLRFTPRFEAASVPSGAVVRLQPVGEIRDSLRQATVRPAIAAMLETLRVWNPLYDRLVELWCETVEDDLPELAGSAGVVGGWPCRMWPEDWTERRRQWLADYRAAAENNRYADAHRHPKSNFARLRSALERCPEDSAALTGREVGWIRRVLANTITAHGAPGSETRAALRATQAAVAVRPTYAALARVLSARMDRYPDDGGLPSLDPIAADVTEEEASVASPGSPMPPHLLAKAARALEAPVGELVDRGVIGSGEVLAQVLPQITSQLLAANIDDNALASAYARTYGAFRRRRSLLLLNLEHQVRFDELPWIAAIAPFRAEREQVARAADQTLRETTVLALGAFPQAILPNPLLRELSALTSQAGLRLPLVEEVAADIFMGTFTTKWRNAATVASRTLSGTLYGRYYNLPGEWPAAEKARKRWRKSTAEDFTALCVQRSQEARTGGDSSYVASNGVVLEQSQILTSHNLAVLVDALDLTDWARDAGGELADRSFAWLVRRLSQPAPTWVSGLQAIKNAAYAWRQAIFFLSFCEPATQRESMARLRDRAAVLGPRFAPAVDGLEAVIEGGRFDGSGRIGSGGRRLLGWTVGPHWCQPSELEDDFH